MSILAIDTSTQVSSVAVVSDGKLAAELTMQAKLTHSETLLPHIEEVLGMANQKKGELEGIAVSLGPGSFTGLRIGLATAKAMAYALQLPIVGVPTLRALAWHFPVEGFQLLPMIDAQKGNVYVERYMWEHGKLLRKTEVQVLPVEEVIRRTEELPGTVVLMGDVISKRIEGKQTLPMHVMLAPLHLRMPRAANVALCGLELLKEGKTGNVMDMEPVYIRRSEAEVLWEKRHGKAT
ncbi:MAG: tRNA (adenosine(37)-N6)-threonylcarbamoyltransferase complex dimerization subunit type 1 TsaB [Selenomonadaceae bacterium]|nr:tRNA (adenosine(37)-N6)-threonylcarbamoyltransferase complex dimerization subunit type 1 TsaB [Selenomonadaceae bacterium]